MNKYLATQYGAFAVIGFAIGSDDISRTLLYAALVLPIVFLADLLWLNKR